MNISVKAVVLLIIHLLFPLLLMFLKMFLPVMRGLQVVSCGTFHCGVCALIDQDSQNKKLNKDIS